MFKRNTDAAPAATSSVSDAVQQARTRARRRLIGAVVLLVIGVIGFPLVFESQPRPIPVDIPIEIPKKDAVAPLAMPAERSSMNASAPVADAPMATARDVAKERADTSIGPALRDAPKASVKPAEEIITETRADAGRELTPAPGQSAPAKPMAPNVAAALPASSSADTAPAGESARARALLEGKPVVAAEAPRFIVQVGAFADADAAREVRLKVEKLGMKTYTQIAQTASGSRMIRVRVGPFASRDEADRAFAKARAAGIAANVLTL